MLTAIIFLGVTVGGCLLALSRGPFWGLLVYANIYFNVPDPSFNWWAEHIPQLRWSLLVALVTLISMVLHSKKLSTHRFGNLKWVFIFTALTFLISYTNAVDINDAKEYSYMLFTFCITVFIILKAIDNFDKLRLFVLVIIGLGASLSVKAYLEGKRVHGRLENIGPTDANSANEFGMLLAAIIPLMLVFIVRGRFYEKVICILAVPFMLNAFILCNSKGAFLAFVFSLFFVFLTVSSGKVRKYISIVLIFAVPLMLYLSDDHFKDRMSSILFAGGENEATLDTITTGRVAIYKYGLQIAKDHPLGVGPNGFRKLSRHYMPVEMLSFDEGEIHGVRASHNSYLQVLVEQGILGLIIYLYFSCRALLMMYASRRKLVENGMAGSFHDTLVVSLIFSFVSSMVGGMSGAQVYYEFYWWQLAIMQVTYSLICVLNSENVNEVKVS